jgi:oligopeptide/dipeptide ABC transporter ATP-binding protein
MTGAHETLLSIRDVVIEYKRSGWRAQPNRVLHSVSLDIREGETVGLVGESGSGKTTLGRGILGLVPIASGTVTYDGRDITHVSRRERRGLAKEIQVVFQDPYSSLNPSLLVSDILSEPLRAAGVAGGEARARVKDLLDRVGLPTDASHRYPSEFSGGQRQRIAIARALAMRPDVLVCDEPVASLDVSIQAQIINLFLKLRRELGLTMLFISHDLGLVRHVSDRIAIMYLGRIVETGDTQAIFTAPRHPYTRALLDSMPKLRLDADAAVDFRPIRGELPSPLDPPAGCHFHLRCPHAQDTCATERPELRVLGDRQVACLRAHELDLATEKRT